MIKTTYKEIERVSKIHGKSEFKRFLKENNLKPVNVDLIAYCEDQYGIKSYLAYFTLNNGMTVKVNTGNNSHWKYTINYDDYGLGYLY